MSMSVSGIISNYSTNETVTQTMSVWLCFISILVFECRARHTISHSQWYRSNQGMRLCQVLP